ncbi:hypothetical protein BH10ACT9_BH10ACT9_18180 [soil metagenome]
MKAWFIRHTRTLAIVLAVVVVLLSAVIIAQALMLLWSGWTVPVGNLAEGVGAVGGLATVGALVIAWIVYRNDQAVRASDEKTRREEDQRRQSELVTGWLDDHIESGLGPDHREHYVRLHLINASQGVVYDVFIRVTGEPSDPVSAGGAAPQHREARGYMHALPPKTAQLTIRMPHITHSVKSLEIYFRDARNQRWMRDSSGELRASEGDPFPVLRKAFWKVELAPTARPQIAIQILWDESSN